MDHSLLGPIFPLNEEVSTEMIVGNPNFTRIGRLIRTSYYPEIQNDITKYLMSSQIMLIVLNFLANYTLTAGVDMKNISRSFLNFLTGFLTALPWDFEIINEAFSVDADLIFTFPILESFFPIGSPMHRLSESPSAPDELPLVDTWWKSIFLLDNLASYIRNRAHSLRSGALASTFFGGGQDPEPYIGDAENATSQTGMGDSVFLVQRRMITLAAFETISRVLSLE